MQGGGKDQTINTHGQYSLYFVMIFNENENDGDCGSNDDNCSTKLVPITQGFQGPDHQRACAIQSLLSSAGVF